MKNIAGGGQETRISTNTVHYKNHLVKMTTSEGYCSYHTPSLMPQTVYPAHSGYHGAPELIFETGSVFLTSCHAPIRVTFLAISRPSLPTLGAYSTVEIIRITTKLGLTMNL